MRKKKQLDKFNLFEFEKKRLNEMGKNSKLPGRENYKKELNNTIEKLIEKKT